MPGRPSGRPFFCADNADDKSPFARPLNQLDTLYGQYGAAQAGGRDMSAEQGQQLDRKGRMAERRHVAIPVKVRRPGESWFVSRIADLSITGFRLQSFMRLQVGAELWIMLPGFEGRRARVQWTRAHEAGCTFERPLHPAIWDHILRTALTADQQGAARR